MLKKFKVRPSAHRAKDLTRTLGQSPFVTLPEVKITSISSIIQSAAMSGQKYFRQKTL